MRTVYIILKNDVEIRNRDYEEFMEKGLSFIFQKGINDSNPSPVLITEEKEEAEQYLRNSRTTVSEPLGNSPATRYRDVTYYDISKVDVPDELYDEHSSDLREVWADDLATFYNEEWSYDVSEL